MSTANFTRSLVAWRRNAAIVDEIQEEVKVEREKRYTLERRASAENITRENARMREAQQKAADAAQAARRERLEFAVQAVVWAAAAALLVFALYTFYLTLFGLFTSAAPVEAVAPPARRVCVAKFCVPLPKLKLKL